MESPLKKLSQLPSLPTVAIQLLRMFSDPEVSIADVVKVLQTDPALAGKILKAANTSKLGMRRQVSDLQRAVVLLGKKSVTALALGFSLSEASMNTGPHAGLYSDFWFQSLVRGVAASVLSEKYKTIDQGEAFTVGLLARIGRLALLNNCPDRFVPLMTRAAESGIHLDQLEAESDEFTSIQVSLHLLKEWNLPGACVSAVERMTLSVDEACSNHDDQAVTLADVLQVATAFGEFFSGEQRGLAIAKVYELMHSIMGEPEDAANDMVDRIRRELDDHSELFSVDVSNVGSPIELLMQAMQQLSALAAASVTTSDEPRPVSSELAEENGRLRKRVMELTRSSMTDGLTSLYNRNYLMQQLEERFRRAGGDGAPIGLLFLDVDHFKKFNDVHGHLAGDEVLRQVAHALLGGVRDDDVVARYGGEEFVVLSGASELNGLQHQAQRLRKSVESLSVRHGGQQLSVTVSVGGAMGVPSLDDDGFCMHLLKSADSAMYESKANGRNRVTIVDLAEVAVRCGEPAVTA